MTLTIVREENGVLPMPLFGPTQCPSEGGDGAVSLRAVCGGCVPIGDRLFVPDAVARFADAISSVPRAGIVGQYDSPQQARTANR